MPALWEQRRELKGQILEVLNDYMQDKPLEKCQNLALGYAGMVADLIPVKKLVTWLDLLKALKEQDVSNPR